MALKAWQLGSCGRGASKQATVTTSELPVVHQPHFVRDPLTGVIGRDKAYKPACLHLSTISIMFRSGHAASLTRSSLRYVPPSTSRIASSLARAQGLRPTASPNLNLQKRSDLALILHKPLSTSLQRYATKPSPPFDHIDKKHEEAVEHEKIEPHPEEVSVTSSVHQVFHEKGVEETEKDEDMLAGVKADFVGFPPRLLRHGSRAHIWCYSKPSRKLLHSMRFLGKPS